MKIKDIKEGDIFGSWKIIKEVEQDLKSGHRRFECLCLECSVSFVVFSGNLISGSSKRCYNCWVINNKKYPEYISSTRKKIYSNFKAKAKSRKIPFEISIEEVLKLLDKQKYRCALTNEPLEIDMDPKNGSLDRIDSSLGYIRGNVQWVLKDINIMKNQLDEKYFISLCSKVIEHSKIIKYVKN